MFRQLIRYIAVITALWAGANAMPGIVRLHVIANSDSEADQRVKLRVRDAVINYLEDLGGAESQAEALAYVDARTDQIATVAEDVLQDGGFTYGAEAMTGIYHFPEKTYGDTTLPEGDYTALRVVLGDGEGQNWWCVLFPPLCLLEPTDVEEGWKQSDGVEYESFLWNLFDR